MAFAIPLPIDEFQKTIEDRVKKNPVTILTAETGAGKSTRVPYWFWKSGKCVHVTQPRRIAARSLAHYLAHELDQELGGEIGYQTGFETKRSRRTRLLYLTDGVKMVQEIKNQRDYDILVLDEVHEWNLNQEVLVGLVKRGLESGSWQRSGKRVIIMSATLNASQVSAFFAHVPVISVPGRGYPVTTHVHSSLFLLPDAAQMVEEKRNLLVFQPGKHEIEEFSQNLRRMLDAEKHKAMVLPLHSELSLKEQAKVFEHFPLPKVVVATDIAQTSLTIDDIDAVIDCGVKKEVRVVNGIEGLYPMDISASECWQRAGRAGRVKPGAYILCAEKDIRDRSEFPEPEIRRLNLESVILRMIQWGLDPLDFPFFHKPKRNLVLRAIEKLMVFGAITVDREITKDGQCMAELPVTVRSARLLLEAQKGGVRVVDRALKIIAIIESKGITGKEYHGERYASGPYVSDLLNQLALWETAKRNSLAVSMKKMAMAGEIYKELKKRLQIPPPSGSFSARDERQLFRAILSSFVDGIFFRSESGYCKNDEERQIDRYSLVAMLEKKPEMIVGLPFDLTITRTHPQTGKTEDIHFPLLTFCSEVSLPQLEDLTPFSYAKETKVAVREGFLTLFEHHHIGGGLLKTVEKQADWKNPVERELLSSCALEWLLENISLFSLVEEEERCERWFSESAAMLPRNHKLFDDYWREFLARELGEYLAMQDLKSFVSKHPGFHDVRLDRLLPATWIERLRRQGWPGEIELAGKRTSLQRQAGSLFIPVDTELFMQMNESDTIVATGERAGIIIDNQRFSQWSEAVERFNETLKSDVFKKKWFFDRKPARMEDLHDVPFPIPFVGGRGKEQVPFEFFSAPLVEDDQVYLIHFISKNEAETYFRKIHERWNEVKKRFQKSKLDSLFRGKGWQVK